MYTNLLFVDILFCVLFRDVPEWIFQIPAETGFAGFANKIPAVTGIIFILSFTFKIKVEAGAVALVTK